MQIPNLKFKPKSVASIGMQKLTENYNSNLATTLFNKSTQISNQKQSAASACKS